MNCIRLSLKAVLFAGILLTNAPGVVAGQPELPKVTIMGKSFWYYEAEKGESIFGIAKKFGWDPGILADTNRELSSPLEKGALLYYPVRKSEINPEKLTGKDVASSCDSARETDVATTNILDAAAQQEENGITIHSVKKGETLFGIARHYDSTVEDIYRLNPGLSYDDPLTPGEKIRVRPGSRQETAVPQMVDRQELASVSTYKVRRGDTWKSVAEANNITEELLREANPDKSRMKRGDIITIPTVETVAVEEMVVNDDPREQTEEGLRELYNEVHSIGGVYDADGNINPTAIGVAVVIADPDSNRDMEFARGALMAVDSMKERPFAIRFTVIDGSQPDDEVSNALEGFHPQLIITTSDKSLPETVLEYASLNPVHVVNAFDVKDEGYAENPALIQYLSPTSCFNNGVAGYIADTYHGYTILVAGRMDGSDTMGEAILKAYIEAHGAMPTELPSDELATATLPDPEGKYLVYATPSAKDDVRNMLDNASLLSQQYPAAEIRVIGRPNWITMADGMRQSFNENMVLLPTRFYFRADAPQSRQFIDGYRDLFGHTPMKSYPVYSVAAYDIMTYFLPNMHATGGDFNAEFKSLPTLQSPIDITRVSNWGGFVNPDAYVLEFDQFANPKAVTVKAMDK